MAEKYGLEIRLPGHHSIIFENSDYGDGAYWRFDFDYKHLRLSILIDDFDDANNPVNANNPLNDKYIFIGNTIWIDVDTKEELDTLQEFIRTSSSKYDYAYIDFSEKFVYVKENFEHYLEPLFNSENY